MVPKCAAGGEKIVIRSNRDAIWPMECLEQRFATIQDADLLCEMLEFAQGTSWMTVEDRRPDDVLSGSGEWWDPYVLE